MAPDQTRSPHPEPLGFVIASVGHAASSSFDAALAPAGLSPRHFAVLRGLQAGEAQSQQDLAHALGIPASRIVGLLDELVARGYVFRRESASDRRVKVVAILDAGRTALTELTALAARSEQLLVRGLSAQDKKELRRLLGVIYDNVATELDGVRARLW